MIIQKLKKVIPAWVAVYSLALPLISYAVETDIGGGILGNIKTLLNTVIGVLFVLATVIFLWGVIQFIASSGSEEGRKKAKGIMTWGIIGLAVMAAAWGVANILLDFFGVEGQRPTTVPPPAAPGTQTQSGNIL